MMKTLLKFSGLVFGSTLLMAGSVQAAEPLVNVCVSSSGRIVYVQDEGEDCSRGYDTVALAVEGPQGEPGLDGTNGEDGEDGEDGVTPDAGTIVDAVEAMLCGEDELTVNGEGALVCEAPVSDCPCVEFWAGGNSASVNFPNDFDGASGFNTDFASGTLDYQTFDFPATTNTIGYIEGSFFNCSVVRDASGTPRSHVLAFDLESDPNLFGAADACFTYISEQLLP